jgi:hypothetical protein
LTPLEAVRYTFVELFFAQRSPLRVLLTSVDRPL